MVSASYAAVPPQWMIPAAAGAAIPKAFTCAITSCRVSRSNRAAVSKSMFSASRRICESASSEIARPSRRSSSARMIQRLRHVRNLKAGEKTRDISAEA